MRTVEEARHAPPRPNRGAETMPHAGSAEHVGPIHTDGNFGRERTPARAPTRRDPVVHRTRRALALLFGPLASRPFAVRLWNGLEDSPGTRTNTPAFTLLLRTPTALRDVLLPPTELRLGEGFVRGLVDVEGDLETAQAIMRERATRASATPRAAARVVAALLRLPTGRDPRIDRRAPARRRWLRLHSPRRDALAVRAHYDVGNDFYALWLDRRMVYSCAYFETGTEGLDTAQEAKLDHLCRKLRLRPGERLLDIGCGWGGLIMHAASRYGVEALGITLSEAQASLARQRIAAAGLAGRCRVEVCDYRAVTTDRPFDKVVSVGMFEHVGPQRLATYVEQVHRLLASGGLFLNHGIVCAPRPRGLGHAIVRRLRQEGQFMGRYVFPDGELVPLAALIGAAERAGFETRDVESLREHYARTLRHWVARLEGREPEAVRLVGSQTFRVWRLYMAASAHAFATARLGLAQVLFAKPGPDGSVALPPTRADLYSIPRPTLSRA